LVLGIDIKRSQGNYFGPYWSNMALFCMELKSYLVVFSKHLIKKNCIWTEMYTAIIYLTPFNSHFLSCGLWRNTKYSNCFFRTLFISMVARSQCNIHMHCTDSIEAIHVCLWYIYQISTKKCKKLRCSYLIHHFHTQDNFLINKKVSSNRLNCMNNGNTRMTDANKRLDKIGARLAVCPRKCLCDYHEGQENCCICTNTRKLWFIYPATQFVK